MSSDHMAVAHPPSAQREGIVVAPILTFLVGILIVISVGVWAASLWFKRVADDAHNQAAATATYPELQQAEVHARSLLVHYRIISSQDSIFQIPVERAIDLVVQEGRSATELTSEVHF